MQDDVRQKLYSGIEHLNASINIFRSAGRPELAEKVKEFVREINNPPKSPEAP